MLRVALATKCKQYAAALETVRGREQHRAGTMDRLISSTLIIIPSIPTPGERSAISARRG